MGRPSPTERKNRKPDFEKGPVRTMVDAAITAFENARGLNIGGPESGRRAKAKAQKKTRRY